MSLSHSASVSIKNYFPLKVGKQFYNNQFQSLLIHTSDIPQLNCLSLFSCLIVEVSFLTRFSLPEFLDIQAYFTVLIVLGTWPYLLFFCRAIRLLGPFVLLVSRVILSDLVKFGIIYLLFVLGFSQSFYIIFTSHNGNHMQDPKCRPKNPLGNISESIMNTILMSLNDFDRIACHFDETSHPSLSTIMFLLYMPVSAVLLINLFIAMIGLPRSVTR